MREPVNPISAEMKLAQLWGDESLTASAAAGVPAPAGQVSLTGNLFEDVLSKTVAALDGVNQSEIYANQMIDKYLRGEAELQQVMVATSKMSIVVQLAVTVINSAVTTFKEITQMQV